MRSQFFIVRVLVLLITLITFAFMCDTYATEFLVKMNSNKSNLTLHSFFAQKSLGEKRLIKEYAFASLKHVSLDESNLKQFMTVFATNVEYIEPNYTYHAIETDPLEDIMVIPVGQWGLKPAINNGIEAEKAWTITQGSKNIIVGVVDTGVDYNHPALKKNIASDGWNFVANNNNPMDDNMHGTHCAGIIAANSTKAMGIAPKVKILPLKFLDSSGSGTLSAAVSAIEYGVNHKANILSNSWGGGSYAQSLADVITYAKSKGVLFIAAAGNDYGDNDIDPSYPASYKIDNIIVVGASTSLGEKASFSNYGIKSVDLFAPGENILSTIPYDKVESLSGTSMACPFVSGVAGLVFSRYPNYNYIEVKKAILNNVTKMSEFSDVSITGGLLNAYKALK